MKHTLDRKLRSTYIHVFYIATDIIMEAVNPLETGDCCQIGPTFNRSSLTTISYSIF